MADNNTSVGKSGYTSDMPTGNIVSVEDALSSSQSRTSTHDIVGQAIQQAKLGDVVSGYPADTNLGTGLSSGVFTIPNASSGTVNFRYSDSQDRVILAVPDVSVYIMITGVATQWPNASVGGGNFPVYVMNDWGLSDNVGIVTRVVMRNNTGSDQQVFAVCRWRIIVNSSPVLSGQSVSGLSQ